jgi:hypothetical protein
MGGVARRLDRDIVKVESPSGSAPSRVIAPSASITAVRIS